MDKPRTDVVCAKIASKNFVIGTCIENNNLLNYIELPYKGIISRYKQMYAAKLYLRSAQYYLNYEDQNSSYLGIRFCTHNKNSKPTDVIMVRWRANMYDDLHCSSLSFTIAHYGRELSLCLMVNVCKLIERILSNKNIWGDECYVKGLAYVRNFIKVKKQIGSSNKALTTTDIKRLLCAIDYIREYITTCEIQYAV